MEKIIYPGMKQAPVPPVKLEGVPEKEITYADIANARDCYVKHAYFLTEKRTEVLLKFAQARDSVIESPTKNAELATMHQEVQFLDAVIRRTLDLYRASNLLADIDNGLVVIPEELPTLISVIPAARKMVVELIGKDVNATSAVEQITITVLNDYVNFSKIMSSVTQ